MIEKRNRSGKYVKLAEILEKRVADTVYVDQIPIRRELADEFQIDIKTVDRAVATLVKRGLLVRVPGYGTFISGKEPNTAGINTRNVNTRKYAFIVAKSDGFAPYLNVLNACDDAISRINGSIIYTNYDEREKPIKFIGRLRAQRFEGVFILGTISDKLLKEIRKEFNTVLIDSGSGTESVNTVEWDNFSMGYDMGQGLIQQGCTSFSFVAFADDKKIYSNNKARLDGLRSAINEAGLKLSVHFDDWSLSALAPNHDLSKEIISANANKHALITPKYRHIFPILAKTGAISQLPDLRIASLAIPDDLELALRGVYAVTDMRKLGQAAAEVLTAIIGRPRIRFRKEVIKADILVVE